MNELTRIDDEREAVVRAARAYDQFHEQITDLRNKLNDVTLLAAAKQTRIEQLEFSLSEERSRATMLQNERDQAVLVRSELSVLFHSILAQMTAFTEPLPELPVQKRKKKKAEANGNGVSEQEATTIEEVQCTPTTPSKDGSYTGC